MLESLIVKIRKHKLAILVAVVGLGAYLFSVRDSIIGGLAREVVFATQRESAYLAEKSLSHEFMVYSGNVQNSVSLRSLIRNHPFLLTYHSQCPPCQEAVASFLEMLHDDSVTKHPSLLVLADSLDTPPPAGLPIELFLRPATDEFDSLLKGRIQVYPVLWRFDAEGKYIDRLTAFDSTSFKEFLMGGKGDAAAQ